MTEKNWDVLTVSGEEAHRNILFAQFSSICLGSQERDQNSMYYFQTGNREKIDSLLENSAVELPCTWSWSVRVAEDWHLAWKDNFTPIIFNSEFAVVPDWETKEIAAKQIRIKPGNAFGTGHHETTWLILQSLIENITHGCSVLDIGTGSGILSIAAKMLGAGEVTCIESDDSCRQNFMENLSLNGLETELTFSHCDAASWTDFSQDLILINVNRQVIMKIIPGLKHSGGRLLLSGILESDVHLIRSECLINGIQIDNIRRKGDWVCLSASTKLTKNSVNNYG